MVHIFFLKLPHGNIIGISQVFHCESALLGIVRAGSWKKSAGMNLCHSPLFSISYVILMRVCDYGLILHIFATYFVLLRALF